MKVLCVAAHPDDEALGCGGTLARHAVAGDDVHVMLLTDGVGARAANGPAERDQRNDAARKAAGILGASVSPFDLPDNRLDTVALLDVVKLVEDVVERVSPNVVYTHHGGDLNVDHRIAHQAVMTACRPVPGSTVMGIYAFEVPSSTEWASDALQPFLPNHFVEISSTLDRKIEALQAYGEEMRAFPHPRSMEAVRSLAIWRGASVGLEAAEAFMTIRRIEC